MHEFGASQGVSLYQELEAAADRNVSIRCVSIWLYHVHVSRVLECVEY